MRVIDQRSFLNVDLELAVDIEPGALISAFEPHAVVLARPAGRVAFELNTPVCPSTPEPLVRRFAQLIKALPPEARQVWDRATQRVFDIGIHAFAGAPTEGHRLSLAALQDAVDIGAEIAITVYTPRQASIEPRIDHVAIPARDPRAAAQFLGKLLGIEPLPDGPEGAFMNLLLGAGSRLLFVPSDSVHPQHLALKVGPNEFEQIVARLRASHVVFGSDPEDLRNQRSDDPLGGNGRVYFVDLDAHLLEVCC
jgi:catechol 2,3-dioxygenase-like lactoylglutathione lyase family enzyme